MPDALEQPAASRTAKEPGPFERVRRDWLWANTAQWIRTDETASKPDLWAALATPVSRRRAVARGFASKVGGVDGVAGIWVTDLANDLGIAVALDDPSLEIAIRNVFIDLVCSELDPSEGELFAFPTEQVPDWAKSGENLS